MNPYKILGVDPSATQDELKVAWKNLAREFHPDKNSDPGALKKLQEINEAYELIKTPEKRSMFDMKSNPRSFKDFGRGFNPADFVNEHFSDFIRTHVSKSLNLTVQLTIDEIMVGKRITEKVNVDGEEIELDFAVPAGVPDHARFNIKKFTTKTGFDIIISATVVTIQEPDRQRHGNDVIIIKTISAFDAILGTELDIEPINGQKIKLKIPSGTQPDARLVMRGIGLPIFNSLSKGNIIAMIKVEIPKDLTEEQLDIITKLR